MQMLADSGYHSILPDQYYDYLVYGKPLPSKPFMITYDDTDLEQFTIGKTEMDKHGFQGRIFYHDHFYWKTPLHEQGTDQTTFG
jgi:hypothetical protein